ncbi:MAG: DUF2330 domain-containing protein [Armatimonadota bacterium]
MTSRTTSTLIAVSAFLLCVGAPCLADGCLMPPKADEAADIREPEQKALIWYHDGVEDLILQVKYEGDVESFAWMVPCPAKPEVDKVEGAPFHELSLLTAPVRKKKGRARLLATRSAAEEEAVEVLERKEVGAYDIPVLKATDAAKLKTWLDENGFALPEGAEPILERYVQRRWYYVAMRIAPGKEEAAAGLKEGVITPLRLTFTCPTIIYPMRMTAINGGETEVLLYVAAPYGTRAEGFEEEYFREWPEGFEASERYPTLSALFGDEPIALTKLRAKLNTSDVTDDVYLAVREGSPERAKQPIFAPPIIVRTPPGESATERILRAPGGFLLWGFGGDFPIGLITLIVVVPLAGAIVFTRLRRMRQYREQLEAAAQAQPETGAEAHQPPESADVHDE